MRPTVTRGATHNFQPPENWVPETDGQCGDLQVRADTFGERNIVELFSTWKPTDEERELIAAGGVIEIGVCQTTQPVMSVCVVDPVNPSLIKYVAPQAEEPSAKGALTINEDAHGF
jgi:hypothetical protein